MARDHRISDIFYYFEQHTTIASGRTVGRKIGVVQEILCKKLLLTSDKIRDCVVYEPKLLGRSGATHKVEFVILKPTLAVELSLGKSFEIAQGLSATVSSIDSAKLAAKLTLVGEKKNRLIVRPGMEKFLSHFIPGSTLLMKVAGVNASRVRLTILDTTSPVASIESKRVGAQRFSSSDKLGSGIQTIEKAKQASLVAVDFDLRFNGTLLAQAGANQKRAFRSFVVLGNGVHWTAHDLAILETYVDYTYLANDDAIIRYADFVRQLSQKASLDFFAFFMAYFQGMTKTPADAFVVSDADFTSMRPKHAGSLLVAIESQIPPYPVTTL